MHTNTGDLLEFFFLSPSRFFPRHRFSSSVPPAFSEKFVHVDFVVTDTLCSIFSCIDDFYVLIGTCLLCDLRTVDPLCVDRVHFPRTRTCRCIYLWVRTRASGGGSTDSTFHDRIASAMSHATAQRPSIADHRMETLSVRVFLYLGNRVAMGTVVCGSGERHTVDAVDSRKRSCFGRGTRTHRNIGRGSSGDHQLYRAECPMDVLRGY